jgi:colanic acid biosynthesis glycosyl transferase WcaI
LKARAEASGARNIMFLPLQPRELMPLQLSAADALVITQRRSISDVVFPGKLLYYMAAARPLVAAVSADSETGRFISEQKVGVVVPPEEPRALAEAIRRLQSDQSRLETLGANARRTVEEQFDRDKVLERFALRLESLQPGKR